VKDHVAIREGVDPLLLKVLHDPQTAGGLLVSLEHKKVGEYLVRLADQGVQARQIGEVAPRGQATVMVD
jgi:selenophosphate synthase